MDELYTKKYYSEAHFKKRQKLRPWENRLGKSLVEQYGFKTILDLGCGLGHYLEGALLAGASEIVGCDFCFDYGKIYIPQNVLPFIFQQDVSEEFNLDKRFDLVMSVEVAEHVPKERSDAFINNLLKHAKKNVLFTAAPPGQHGTGHVNCQPKEFWFEKFSSRGWKPDEEYTNKIKELWFSLRTPPYIIRNLNMFIPIL